MSSKTTNLSSSVNVKAEYVPYLPSAKENTVRFEIQRDKFVTQPVLGSLAQYGILKT